MSKKRVDNSRVVYIWTKGGFSIEIHQDDWPKGAPKLGTNEEALHWWSAQTGLTVPIRQQIQMTLDCDNEEVGI